MLFGGAQDIRIKYPKHTYGEWISWCIFQGIA